MTVRTLPLPPSRRIWLAPTDTVLIDGGMGAIALAASPSLHLVLFGRSGPLDIHHADELAARSSAAVRAVERDASGVRRVLIELGPARQPRRRHRRPTRRSSPRHATGDFR